MAKDSISYFIMMISHLVQYTVETGSVLTERLGLGGVAEFTQRVL